MTLKINIKMDNAAFADDGNDGRSEAARILRSATTWLEEGSPTGFPLHDINGNKVGEAKVSTQRTHKPDLTEFIGETWTLQRKAGKVYVTHVRGHTVALNDPAYPSAPDFHVPDYVLRVAKRMLKP